MALIGVAKKIDSLFLMVAFDELHNSLFWHLNGRKRHGIPGQTSHFFHQLRGIAVASDRFQLFTAQIIYNAQITVSQLTASNPKHGFSGACHQCLLTS